jgi:hypothetical protein
MDMRINMDSQRKEVGMRKRIVSAIFLSGFAFIAGLSVAQADILEWK